MGEQAIRLMLSGRMRASGVLCLAAASVLLLAGCTRLAGITAPRAAHPKRLLNYDRPLLKIIDRPIDRRAVSLLVDKSGYTLTVKYEGRPVKSYPVVLGADPVRDKLMEGDRRTPEGVFHVRDRYPHRSWSKFIWLDYPTARSWAKHRAAKRAGDIPTNAAIGGEIGIHGVPQGADYLIDEGRNWTLGCISLKNKDVNEIYGLVRKGTEVTIVR